MEDENKEVINAYCLRCKEKREMKDPVFNLTKTNMRMAKGTCPVCDCKMAKILGKASHESSR